MWKGTWGVFAANDGCEEGMLLSLCVKFEHDSEKRILRGSERSVLQDIAQKRAGGSLLLITGVDRERFRPYM